MKKSEGSVQTYDRFEKFDVELTEPIECTFRSDILKRELRLLYKVMLKTEKYITMAI